jgi:ADP-ribose pyrophosphatase
MELSEKTLETQRIYEGRIINLRVDTIELVNGKTSKREIVEHKGAVCIVPLLPDGQIIMVRQFRKPCEKDLLEIPAGSLEIGENPEACAARELSEETGKAGQLSHLFSCYLAPGYSTELIHCYLAENLTDDFGTPDEDEHLNVETHSLQELLVMCDDGRIQDAKTIAALNTLYRKRNSL